MAHPTNTRVSDTYQVYHVSFTWNKVDDIVETEFVADPERVGRHILETYPDAKFVYQLERGKETGRLHYQGNIHFTKSKHRPLTVAADLRGVLQGIFVCCDSNNGRRAANFYAMKADTREAGPWFDPSHVEENWDFLSPPSGWQLPLYNMLTKPAQRRVMIWVWEESGCTGKSEFGTYMEVHHKVIKLGLSTAPDNLYAVSEMIADRPNGFIFDVPRSLPKRFDWAEVYMSMEQIKDGNFLSTKYKPKKCLYSHCMHIVVFSNVAPDYNALSRDRWRVFKINGDRLVPSNAVAADFIAQYQEPALPPTQTDSDEDEVGDAAAGGGVHKRARVLPDTLDPFADYELLNDVLPLGAEQP